MASGYKVGLSFSKAAIHVPTFTSRKTVPEVLQISLGGFKWIRFLHSSGDRGEQERKKCKYLSKIDLNGLGERWLGLIGRTIEWVGLIS